MSGSILPGGLFTGYVSPCKSLWEASLMHQHIEKDRVSMMAKLFHTSDLNGLTGDNGENWCLFVRNVENPLASGWKWFFEEDNANMWAKDWGIKIK
jgi:hypothetical protein